MASLVQSTAGKSTSEQLGKTRASLRMRNSMPQARRIPDDLIRNCPRRNPPMKKTVIELHGVGLRGIRCPNPADDPGQK